jgi:hypothetical protein
MCEELFAEKFIKVSFRNYTKNTRMDIKNVDHRKQQVKRDRMLNYWHNNVVENFLPPIDLKRREEVEMRKSQILDPVRQTLPRVSSSVLIKHI